MQPLKPSVVIVAIQSEGQHPCRHPVPCFVGRLHGLLLACYPLDGFGLTPLAHNSQYATRRGLVPSGLLMELRCMGGDGALPRPGRAQLASFLSPSYHRKPSSRGALAPKHLACTTGNLAYLAGNTSTS